MIKAPVPAKAKLTMVLTRMSSLLRDAPIAPIPNTPKKRARPSYREKLRCGFWLAPTGAHRKFVSSKELGWVLMNAPSRLFVAGNLCRRMMARAAPFRPGSPSKLSSAFSRQFFSYGAAFSTVPYDFAENDYKFDPQAPSPAAAALRANEPESAFWIRRFLPRGRPSQSPPHPPACSGALPPRCFSPG
jgi:hypothetical protein